MKGVVFMKIFAENELIRIGDKAVEKEFAFPDLEGDQTAIMCKWDGEKWLLSGWGCVIDGAGQEVCGWEPLFEGNRKTALEVASIYMDAIEVGEE